MSERREHVKRLRIRADLGRRTSFASGYFELPQPVQDALYGIAAELEAAANAFESALSERDDLARDIALLLSRWDAKGPLDPAGELRATFAAYTRPCESQSRV